MKPVQLRLSALPLIVSAMLIMISGIAKAGEVAFDYADVEWVRPVTRTVAVPVAETLCDEPDANAVAPNGDVRSGNPGIGLADAIRRESMRQPVKPRCQVLERVDYREEIVAYQVRYRYAGEDYERRLSYDPGEQLRVRIEVSAGSSD
jgi:hypothetical protein